MIVIGLTGSIGMGKTETGKLFAKLGIPVSDSDAIVHALYDKGGAAVEAIAKAFPEAVQEGRVDRAILGGIVTDDPSQLQCLEKIVHPLVRAAQRDFIERHRDEKIVVLDIPLLFETGRDREVDKIVVVSAPPDVQRARVLARKGMTGEKFAAILARQTPDVEKRARADFIVDTSQGLDHAERQLRAIIAKLANHPD
jgi:dephospho-CoA kinase